MTAVDVPQQHGFLRDAGAMGDLIATFDWATNQLGPIETWEPILRDTVSLLLHSDVPMVLLWGIDGVMIYNDGYSRFAAGRHPASLGSNVRESWPEIADFNDHVVRTMLAGKTLRYEAQELVVARDGAPETIWLDLDYSPVIDEHGTARGGLVLVFEVTHRIVAERAASDSREQFRILSEALPIQVWTADASGRFNWFNDRVHAYSGTPPQELAGATSLTSLIHPDDRSVAREAWRTALTGGTTYETEFRIRRHDGAYLWHLVRALPSREAGGQITGWIGSNTDIDERKRAETRNARDRDRLWRLSQDLMLVCDMQGVITAVNPSAQRLLGWSEGEMIGHNLLDFIHPDDLAATLAELDRLGRGSSSFAFKNRYRTSDGGYRLLDWTATPDAGRVHAVARDITEERKLARDRERIWTLSPVLKLVLTQGGTILAANPSWTQTLGWSESETVGHAVVEFIADEQVERLPARLAGLTEGSVAPESEWLFKHKDGSLRHTQWTTVAEAGTLYSFGRDVTEAANAAAALAVTEEALRQSQKMEAVGQLTGGIAHDFNNLLQGITGSLEIIERRLKQGRTDELDRFIQGATTAANRAAALTHRLLAFSRRQPIDPRPVRANPLIASVEDLLRRTLGEQVALEMMLADDLWPTRCDPNQLENAVLNLAINARDAMPDGGKLVIETCNARLDDAMVARQRDLQAGDYVCLAVTDTGTGMSTETIAHAFEPFFTTKPIGQGTGLGLSMIYGFARQSEGYARIYSEPGRGTTVKLFLPRYRGGDASEDITLPQSDPQDAQLGERVLVIEDEPVVRELILEVLDELGYQTLQAQDGPSGLAILQGSAPIDLLITDIGLPGLNGRQVADAARMVRPDLRILFMTGYAENAAVSAGFLDPGMALITKPFAIDAFAARIRAILEEGAR